MQWSAYASKCFRVFVQFNNKETKWVGPLFCLKPKNSRNKYFKIANRL